MGCPGAPRVAGRWLTAAAIPDRSPTPAKTPSRCARAPRSPKTKRASRQRTERRDPNGACGSSKKKSIQLRLSKGANLLCAFVLRPLQQNNKRRRALASKLGGWDPIRGIVVILRGTVERENPMNTTKRIVGECRVNICACKRVSRPSEGCVLRVLSCCLEKVCVVSGSRCGAQSQCDLATLCVEPGAMMIPTERPRSTPPPHTKFSSLPLAGLAK